MTNQIVPYFRPEIGPEEIRAVTDSLMSGWLSSGPKVLEFEQAFLAYLKSDGFRAVSVNSATAGLHLACEALGIDADSTIAVPTMTFTATAEILDYLGAKIVLVDSEDINGNISLAELESISDMVDGVIPVHFGGSLVDITRIREILGEDKIIVEDAAHSFTTELSSGVHVSSASNATVYSFYANKTITTGEGGMVIVKDPVIFNRIKSMRTHGLNRDMYARFQSRDNLQWEYDVVAAGYKYNLTDSAAALGVVQLSKAEKMRKRREDIHNIYRNAFEHLPLHVTPLQDFRGIHSHHIFSIQIMDLNRHPRNEVIDCYNKYGVKTSVHYKPLHQMTYWKTKLGLENASFPNADSRFSSTISLPNFPNMQEWEIEKVIEVTHRIFS